jgi:hypothetical protein
MRISWKSNRGIEYSIDDNGIKPNSKGEKYYAFNVGDWKRVLISEDMCTGILCYPGPLYPLDPRSTGSDEVEDGAD